MNVKKMSTELLMEWVEAIRTYDEKTPQAFYDLSNECAKELKRRWGIKG